VSIRERQRRLPGEAGRLALRGSEQGFGRRSHGVGSPQKLAMMIIGGKHPLL